VPRRSVQPNRSTPRPGPRPHCATRRHPQWGRLHGRSRCGGPARALLGRQPSGQQVAVPADPAFYEQASLVRFAPVRW